MLYLHEGVVESVLPVLGAFAFAGLKLRPTVQFLFRDLAQIRFGAVALEALHEDLSTNLPLPPRRRSDNRPMDVSTASMPTHIRMEPPH